MRVLCITQYSDRPEAETFIGLKKAGVDIHIMCSASAPHYKRLVQSGIPVINLELKGRIDLKAIAGIRRLLIRKKFDILHMFTNRAIQNGIQAAKELPVKLITYRGTVGNVSFFDPGSLLTYLHPRVDRIVCVSEAVRRYFMGLKWLWFRVPTEKLVRIYKGHDLAWYREMPGDLRQFGIPENAFVVGCIGRDRPHKGIHVLIESMRFLPEALPIHLLLIGNMRSKHIIKQVQNNPAADRIHLTGYRTDAPALQAACNTIVMPALKREGLPKVVIEAMAYRVAPIVTDVGGNPELIEHGISGLVVEPGNPGQIAEAIIDLYKNPEKCHMIGQSARTRIQQCFRIEHTIQHTLSMYNQCLSVPDSDLMPN